MIVDDDRIAEQNTGDYFPWWLNDLVTAIFDPLPTLDQLKTDEGAVDARNLATNIVEPVFPAGTAPKSTELKVQVEVGLEGAINGVGNPMTPPSSLFLVAYPALRQWRFRPYLRDGKPDLFGADIVFRVP